MGCCQSQEEEPLLSAPSTFKPKKSDQFKPTTKPPNVRSSSQRRGSSPSPKISKKDFDGQSDRSSFTEDHEGTGTESEGGGGGGGGSEVGERTPSGNPSINLADEEELDGGKRRIRRRKKEKERSASSRAASVASATSNGSSGAAPPPPAPAPSPLKKEEQEGEDKVEKRKKKEKKEKRESKKKEEFSDPVLPEVQATRTIQQFFRESRWADDEIAELKAIFNECDLDGNGQIGMDELRTVFRRMNVKSTDKEFKDLFQNLDLDNSGQINFQEFLSGIRWLQKGATFDFSVFHEPLQASDDEANSGVNEKKRMEVYSQYAGLILQNGAEEAEKQLKKGDIQGATAILEVLDVEAAVKIQQLLGKDHEILAAATEERLRKLNEILSQQ